jgi:GNAT superfamily N-acetyltransferase
METGPDFHEDHVLGDGTAVTLRHVRPEDASELRRGLERLSPESRYRRFLGAVTILTDAHLRYLTCVDGQDHVAIVAVRRAAGPDGGIGLGIGRFVRLKEEPSTAEAAITVIDDAQGKGIGRLLALTLARAAYERGIRRFRGWILADNTAVRQLLTDVGAVVSRAEDGGMTFYVELTPTPFTPGSRLDVIARRLLRAARAGGVFERHDIPV